MIDAKTIEELRGLLAVDTSTDWQTVRSDPAEGADVWWICAKNAAGQEVELGSLQGGFPHPTREARARLVVAMRNALPALLDVASRVERAEQLAYTGAISLASIDEGATRPETWKERAENRQAVFLLAKRRAEAAESEAAALREALRPFVSHYEPWMERQADGDRMCVYPVHTMGDLRRARSALEGRDNG